MIKYYKIIFFALFITSFGQGYDIDDVVDKRNLVGGDYRTSKSRLFRRYR